MKPIEAGARSYSVQVRCNLTGKRTQSLYRPFITVDGPLDVPSVALSRNGRWLSYSDAQFRVHVVALDRGRDRVIGRGIMPRFSADGHFVAFMSGRYLSINTLGPQAESLLIYDVHRRMLAKVGTSAVGPLVDFTWAPHSDRIVWQITGYGRLVAGIVTAHQPAIVRRIVLSGNGRTDGGVTWSADGTALLYWRFVRPSAARRAGAPRFDLLRRSLTSGATTVVVPAEISDWTEGTPPPPATSDRGAMIASLLGGAQSLNEVLLYGQRPYLRRPVLLPGEPRVVAFAPAETRLVTVWNRQQGSTDLRHAALVNPRARRVQDLGSAVAAFWLT